MPNNKQGSEYGQEFEKLWDDLKEKRESRKLVAYRIFLKTKEKYGNCPHCGVNTFTCGHNKSGCVSRVGLSESLYRP